LKISAKTLRRIDHIWQHKGVVSTLLLPLSWLIRLAVFLKRTHYRQSASRGGRNENTRPIIVVGNIVTGGTGKTPVVITLTNFLREKGWHPGIISRGYGVAVKGQPRVGHGDLDAAGFGDEPALIARATQAPLAIHPRRSLALQALIHAHPDVDVIVSDDGLQHLALPRDIEIVVQDGRGQGNGRLLPAGPLREPVGRLAEVDYLVTNLTAGCTPPQQLKIRARQVTMQLLPQRVVHLTSGRSATWHEWLAREATGTVAAVAAIGQPQRFFSMLRAGGLQLVKTVALPDHHPYHESPFAGLTATHILVTPKDAVKCAHFADPRLWVVTVATQFSDEGWLEDLNARLHALTEKKKTGRITLSI
jgi:tetraacyldisaccharide 4'-kinase